MKTIPLICLISMLALIHNGCEYPYDRSIEYNSAFQKKYNDYLTEANKNSFEWAKRYSEDIVHPGMKDQFATLESYRLLTTELVNELDNTESEYETVNAYYQRFLDKLKSDQSWTTQYPSDIIKELMSYEANKDDFMYVSDYTRTQWKNVILQIESFMLDLWRNYWTAGAFRSNKMEAVVLTEKSEITKNQEMEVRIVMAASDTISNNFVVLGELTENENESGYYAYTFSGDTDTIQYDTEKDCFAVDKKFNSPGKKMISGILYYKVPGVTTLQFPFWKEIHVK